MMMKQNIGFFFFNSKTKEGENDDMFESVYIKFI